MTTAVEREAKKVGLHMNAEKCKVMVTTSWNDEREIKIRESSVEVVDNFCYLGSYLSSNSNCDKECQVRIGKAGSVFGRLKDVWRNKHISLPIKVKLYKSLVLSTLLYSAELWPLSVTQKKKLEAAHHKFQRRLLGLTWRDKVRNEVVRDRTGLVKLELVVQERRLRWLGHVLRMEDIRIPKQALLWNENRAKQKPGRPRTGRT